MEINHTPKSVQFDFLIEVRASNPNGDKNADNRPRIYPSSGRGYMSPECLKHKVRTVVGERHHGEEGMGVYYQTDTMLDDTTKVVKEGLIKSGVKNPTAREVGAALRAAYWDIRAFGAVVTSEAQKGTAGSLGSTTGCVAVSPAETCHPIQPVRYTIVRCCRTKDDGGGPIGSKWVVPYAIYKASAVVTGVQAGANGFGPADVDALEEGILNMFDLDACAARPYMRIACLVRTDFDTSYNPTQKRVSDNLHIALRPSVEQPERMTDYDLWIDSQVPEGCRQRVVFADKEVKLA